jgi:hypothetical protein
VTGLPLVKTEFPGVYRRGSRFVVVYRSVGRQRKESCATLEEAVAVKLARDAEVRVEHRGPTLHGYALAWVDRYSGSGSDSVREHTRREHQRLLVTFALRYRLWTQRGRAVETRRGEPFYGFAEMSGGPSSDEFTLRSPSRPRGPSRCPRLRVADVGRLEVHGRKQ